MKKLTNRAEAGLSLAIFAALLCLTGCGTGENDQPYTITLDTGAEAAAAGIQPTKSMVLRLLPGELLTELPEPYYPDYQFRGWYRQSLEGEPFVTPWEVNGNLTLYAYWGAGATPESDYRITFNANGGEIEGGGATVEKFVKRPPWRIPELPWPVHGDNAFGGWYRAADSLAAADELTNAKPVTGFVDNATGAGEVFAHWYTGSQTFTVTFLANGGAWNPGEFSRLAQLTLPTAKTLQEAGVWPPNPDLAGFPLVGWFDSDNVEFTRDTRVTKDLSVSAKWVYSALPTIDFSVDETGQFTGTLPDGGAINVIQNDNTTVATVNGYKVLQYPDTAAGAENRGIIDFGQIAGSYLAETQFTVEMYINFGNSAAGGAVKAVRFHTDAGEEADGAFWMEGHGLVIYRPNSGARLSFGLTANDTRNKWYHLAIVRDGSVLHAYLNGSKEGVPGSESTNSPIANPAFKNVSHFKIYNLTLGQLYKVVLSKEAKTEFPGVLETINALNGVATP